MAGFLNDLRYALRTLRRAPGFALVAVLTLALGIGATTALFSVLHAVVLRPLPYPAADRLLWVSESTPDGRDFSTSEPNFLDFRAQSRSFSHLVALRQRDVALLGDRGPEQLRAIAVTPSFFPALGVAPALGRPLRPEEESADARAVVLSEGLHRARFGADPAVVGRTVVLDGDPYTVVGVMPRGFVAPGDAELWMPLAPRSTVDRDDHDMAMLGRLAPGVTAEAAAAELRGVARRLGAAHPETNGGWGVRAKPLRDRMIGGDVSRTLWVLMGAVALLLLLMCANLANLLLARGAARRREIGLRTALGAGRGRIVRQLLAESLLLAAAGAAGGVLLAAWGVPLLRELLPAATPRLDAVRVNGAVLAFAVAASLAVGVLFGLLPALRTAAVDVRGALSDGGRGSTGGGRRLRDGLVVAELALAMTLLVGAGLLASSFLRLREVDTGFAPGQVLAVPLALTGPRYDEAGMARFVAAAEERLRALPGVVAVGATNVAPLSGGGTEIDLSVEGRPSGPGETSFARWRSVTPGFFAATGVPLLRGRLLDPRDAAAGAPEVIVVTRTFAERLFPGQDPLGRRVAMGVNGDNWRTIVGVVPDVRDVALAEAPQPLFFIPDTGGWPWMTLLVRTSAPPAELAAAVRREIWAVDPALPVPVVEPLAAGRARAVAGPRFNLMLMGAFASVALALAVMGVYALMSNAVVQRTREIGIRMALGARPGRVLRMAMGQGGRLVAAGVLLGGLAALALSRVVGSLLYETPAADPRTFAATAVLLGAVALASAWLPARRAARVDPMVALRHE